MTDLTLLRQFAATQRNTTAGAVMNDAIREIERLRELREDVRSAFARLDLREEKAREARPLK